MKRLLILVLLLVPSLVQAISITFVNKTNGTFKILTEKGDKQLVPGQQYGVAIGNGKTNILESTTNKQLIAVNLDGNTATISVVGEDGTVKWRSKQQQAGTYAGTWYIMPDPADSLAGGFRLLAQVAPLKIVNYSPDPFFILTEGGNKQVQPGSEYSYEIVGMGEGVTNILKSAPPLNQLIQMNVASDSTTLAVVHENNNIVWSAQQPSVAGTRWAIQKNRVRPGYYLAPRITVCRNYGEGEGFENISCGETLPTSGQIVVRASGYFGDNLCNNICRAAGLSGVADGGGNTQGNGLWICNCNP